ncbi:HAD-IA family hydrolase [Actinomadura sp. J1-007]|uniref:HAD-IA family hydrolase n=1 Tax=Actinomadura sp. J1-007 TaxID=2661913 RepID=UPI0028164AE5|nr:HAD-IA family hydrolase [Actinomadura sp. J1-007]
MGRLLGAAPALRPRGGERARLLARGRGRAGHALRRRTDRAARRGRPRRLERRGRRHGRPRRGARRAGRRIALLSNIPEELACRYEERHAWLGHFEVRAFSCRIGHAKPEPGAYRWCQEALGDRPDRILFVDDREENIRAAEAAGMRGHLFTTPDRLREHLAREDAPQSPR